MKNEQSVKLIDSTGSCIHGEGHHQEGKITPLICKDFMGKIGAH